MKKRILKGIMKGVNSRLELTFVVNSLFLFLLA